jgi:hypothetical protein
VGRSTDSTGPAAEIVIGKAGGVEALVNRHPFRVSGAAHVNGVRVAGLCGH